MIYRKWDGLAGHFGKFLIATRYQCYYLTRRFYHFCG